MKLLERLRKTKLKPRSLFGKIMISHLVVVFLTLTVVAFFLTYLMERYFFGMREWEMAGQAENIAYLVHEDIMAGDLYSVNKTVEALALSLELKIRVIDQSGVAVAVAGPQGLVREETDEQVGLEEMEIRRVLEGSMLTKKVHGPQLQRLLVAAPVWNYEEESSIDLNEERDVMGAVTVSAPLRGVQETIARISRLTFYSGAIAAALAGLLAFSLAKKITQPLQGINKAALEMAGGKLHRRIAVQSDDEIGRLTHTFNYAVDQVEKTLEEQKQLDNLRRNLIANVSHELRGPLSSLRGYAEVMLDGLVEEEEKDKYLQVIYDNTVHLSRLVDDLLQLSRLESGNLSLQYEKVILQDLAQFSYQSVLPAAEAKGIKMECEVEDSLPPLWGDRSRLHEILRNLLENAVENTPSGGWISLKVYSNHPYAAFVVQDNGCGIPREDLPHIWERFYKVDKSRSRSSRGTGLGLAITKQLVDLHGGKIDLESAVGEGSAFRVFIPFNADKET